MKTMQCPSCAADGPPLVVIERQGIEIDYCPRCRGVWLERGELEKLIERSAPAPVPRDARDLDRRYAERPARPSRDDARSYDDDGDERRGPRRRREGILGDLFDF
jgi:hypothetical protein